jgi:hypothetical protein
MTLREAQNLLLLTLLAPRPGTVWIGPDSGEGAFCLTGDVQLFHEQGFAHVVELEGETVVSVRTVPLTSVQMIQWRIPEPGEEPQS